MGDELNGGWLRSHVEAPTRETFPCPREQASWVSSSLNRSAHLRKLAPRSARTEPTPISYPPFFCSPSETAVQPRRGPRG